MAGMPLSRSTSLTSTTRVALAALGRVRRCLNAASFAVGAEDDRPVGAKDGNEDESEDEEWQRPRFCLRGVPDDLHVLEHVHRQPVAGRREPLAAPGADPLALKLPPRGPPR